MPAYMIVEAEVWDPEVWSRYVAEVVPHFRRYGARYLVRGGDVDVLEGTGPDERRVVVFEFPDRGAALDCWRDPAYEEIRAVREGHADLNVWVVEGYDAPV